MKIKDKQGLYFEGKLKAKNYEDSCKELYQLETLDKHFCVNTDHPAKGYSVIDANGVQHIYDLSPKDFYDNLSNLN